MAFGYTGLANIGRQNTDVWLARILGELSGDHLSAAVEELAAQATASFAKLPGMAKQKRHAFVGVGWTCTDSENLLFSPVICRISNFHDNETVLAAAKSAFTLDCKVYDPLPSFAWVAVGAAVYPGEVATLTRRLNEAGRRGASPQSALRLMATTIRAVADRNDTVGKDLLGVIMPKDVVTSKSVQVWTSAQSAFYIGPGDPDLFKAPSIYSIYYPEHSDDEVIYAPTIACGGWSMENLKSGPLVKT